MVHRAVLYARISVATEESVSVARQLASGRKYAAARDWTVVGEFADEGVSATRNKPVDRAAWQALLGNEEQFDAVIVWKVDRLARRVVDFLHADEVLQARGAAIVCVDQSIDMTTGEGRAFAQMLAVFGEMEAAAMSSRRRAAREYLIATGRATGGRQPYGWRLVRHPDGPGKVRAQDPERIDWVRAMAARALRGDTIYSIGQWLDEAGAPKARGSSVARWGHSSVDRILRNPVLAGMTPHNPGNNIGGFRGPEVLRGPDGLPVLSDDAILTLKEFERLQHVITHKEHHAAIPVERRRSTSPIIARLASCTACGVLLNRFGSGRKFGLRCRRCGQIIAYNTLASYLVQRLLQERGSVPMFRRAWVIPDDPAASRKLATIDRQLACVAMSLTDDHADIGTLGRELARLKQARAQARRRAARPTAQVLADTGRSLHEVWDLCATDDQRREILSDQIEHLAVRKATRSRGRVMDPERIDLRWRAADHPAVVPAGISLDAVHVQPYDPVPWVSHAEAAAFVGCSQRLIRKAAVDGRIGRRTVANCLPSLSRASVERFAIEWKGP